MGFHPDFTGRQNAYGRSTLGLNEKYIDTLMPEIEVFAEIGDYIDQPVRVIQVACSSADLWQQPTALMC